MTTITADASHDNNDDGEIEEEEETARESEFLKKFEKAQKKVAAMKHIDSKIALEGIIFPLMAAMYDDFSSEMDEIHDRIDGMDTEQALSEALANSPEIIKELSAYVIWVGGTFDTLFRIAGFIEVDEKDPTKAKFSAKATDDVKKIYMSIKGMNQGILGKIGELEVRMQEYLAGDDVDDPNADPADDETQQATTQDETPPNPSPLPGEIPVSSETPNQPDGANAT